MTTADYALIVSLFSFFVSLAGFIWNVWSKFIYPKAKIRSNIAVILIMDGDGTPPRKFVQLSATNYGPTEITLRSHQTKRRQGFLGFRRNRQLALVNPVAHPDSDEPTGWLAPGFPKKLAVGESATVYFSPQSPKRWVEEGDLYYFGFPTHLDGCIGVRARTRRSFAKTWWRTSAQLSRQGRGCSTRSRPRRHGFGAS